MSIYKAANCLASAINQIQKQRKYNSLVNNLKSNIYVEFKFKKQNHNSAIVYLKFWAKHESRNQLKIWYKSSFSSNFEQIIENIWKELSKPEYKTWFPNGLNDYINKYLQSNLSELYQLTNKENIIIPNFIQLIFGKNKYNDLKIEIESENQILENEKNNINKYNKKIQKISTKLDNKKFLYKFNWYWNIKNNKKIKWDEQNNIHKNFYNTQKSKIQNLTDELNNTLSENEYLSSTPTNYTNNIIGSNDHDLVFYPIKWAFNNMEMFKNQKGIYVFHNTNNNKYYVGQSKNLYKRIFQDHFDYKTGMCKNPSFCDDYNLNKHNFNFAFKFLNTKDELDQQEKEYIALFDSFNFGYNKTSGNI